MSKSERWHVSQMKWHSARIREIMNLDYKRHQWHYSQFRFHDKRLQQCTSREWFGALINELHIDTAEVRKS